mgnify:CR=1 FL=1
MPGPSSLHGVPGWGHPGAMADVRIDQLESRISDLTDELSDLRSQLAKAQLDQWQGRIEDLEVQLHLGAMETNDRLAPLVEQLRGRWLDARSQVDGATSTATEVIDSLRQGLEQAMRDIREAVLDAKDKATS